MLLRTSEVVAPAALALALVACSSLLPGPSSLPPPSPAHDPTPLARCRVAANSSSPLVTEWPASEKAHLQSLTASQTVAVEYTGCELRIVDGCELPGRYVWHRTTLATDLVEITNADDLYAKLPIGAVGLEGELERSGHLAVRTTVAGQLRSEGVTDAARAQAACADATHYVSGISVGAFQLLSGGDVQGSGSVGALGAEARSRASRREVVLREAGSKDSCAQATDEAPQGQCASPIQLFLSPLASQQSRAGSSSVDKEDRRAAIHVAFPAPENGEVWTLRAGGGRIVCTLPCGAWVGPVSGYYLQREPRDGATMAMLQLPQSFPHPVGSHVAAEYQLERGSPTLSRWAFYGAIPVGAAGVGLTAWGIVQSTRTCPDLGGCFPDGGFLITVGVLWMGMAAAGTWWYLYSRDERFNTYEDLSGATTTGRSSGLPRERGARLLVGPGTISGTF